MVLFANFFYIVEFSNLNLNADQIGDHIEHPNSFLLSQYKDITTFLDEATDGTVIP